MKRTTRHSLLVVAIATVTFAACGGKQETDTAAAPSGGCDAGTGRITIATGNSTGVYYVLGGGYADVINKNSGLSASAAETGASVQNIQQLAAGDYDVAFSLADTAADAVAGEGAFSGKPAEVSALARIYPNYTQVIVRAGAGISSVADMRGKIVSTGSPNSGTEVIARRLLTAAGLDPEKGVQAQRLDLTKTVDGMKDGRIDALFWSGGLPTPAITDLTQTLGDDVTFLDVTPLLGELVAENPVYAAGSIEANVYGTPENIPTIVVPNLLLVRDDMPESQACALATMLVEHKADLAKVHPAANAIDPDLATETAPVPLHPGASQALASGS